MSFQLSCRSVPSDLVGIWSELGVGSLECRSCQREVGDVCLILTRREER
jgi:hypothetical protein